MKNALLLGLLAVATACNSNLTDPQKIIDNAIAASGGQKYLNSTSEFDFRDRHYIAKRNGGVFSYERITKDSINTTHDFLSNDGFRRQINGSQVEVADSMKTRYSASVNSVVYFALLPYGLNDPSVQKKFLGETQIENKEQYVVEITFGQEGGGEDHEDIFIYWINKKDFTIDYMAYSFAENDGEGYRFRKAYNPRRVNGILFFDYINYKPKSGAKLTDLEELFKKGELEELSKIELLNISVE
ncbi:MAG TPA: hypothetical protein PKJ83_06005 [Cyclobacteriaceae bacterium]|nr:hypothetical protein [Cyclobacteriaceae bacterium]HPW62237.1 hypothetical protein [Cyclobacteriaceae bacterium]HRG79057.1 hypothetical protein [Cyclobacteriaceae bacterium]